MTRASVLIATTRLAMAYALMDKLRNPCLALGLRLEICPDGDGARGPGQKYDILPYASAEALFDVLEKRDPMSLSDTLVVLDVGCDLGDAFAPAARSKSEWRPTTEVKGGIALELLLRFPHVFPVFLSSSIPVSGSIAGDGDIDVKKPTLPITAVDEWVRFRGLRDALRVKNMETDRGNRKTEIFDIDDLPALHEPLHFVSPLDGGAGLISTLVRFARGMRCWFDPTGLRTLVRNRFLGTVFGADGTWDNTWLNRRLLLERLDGAAMAVDEEREFAALNAYAIYKFGRRVWMVTTYREFREKPLWNAGALDSGIVIIRDIDIRFPDIPSGMGEVREDLADICGSIWKDDVLRVLEDVHVRAVSADARVAQCQSGCWTDEDRRCGQRDSSIGREFLGLNKPIGTLYEIIQLLPNSAETVSTISGITSIEGNKRGSGGGHGAPYVNLQMTESLLMQARTSGGSPTGNLIGALLAGEAYQLILGMSKTTSLEALLLLHKKEVEAEMEFPGISHDIDIQSRRRDIETALGNLFPQEGSRATDIRNMFLSRFWSELRKIYREGEQFRAADAANAQGLIHSRWLPGRWRGWFSDRTILSLKYRLIIEPATSLVAWIRACAIVNLLFGIGYYYFWTPTIKGESQDQFVKMLFDVFLSFLSQSPTQSVAEIAGHCNGWMQAAIAVHLSVAYILLGMLIAMIFRKITRG